METKKSGVELKPKDAVRRILEAAGATVSDKEAFWLGHHMERFVNHARKPGELGEGCGEINPLRADGYECGQARASSRPTGWRGQPRARGCYGGCSERRV